jgi:hypothetical protein
MLNPFSSANLKSEAAKSMFETSSAAFLQYHIDNQVASSFLYDYIVSEETASMLNTLSPEQRFFPSQHARKVSQHPVLSILNDYANFEIKKLIDRDKKSGLKTMTIGDSADQKLGAHHNCILFGHLKSSKDNTRVATTVRASPNMRNHAINGERTVACHDGMQHCSFVADRMYGVHSLYDISLSDFAEGYLKHEVTSAVFYIYVAPEVLNQEYTRAWPFFKTHISGDCIAFSMRDYSAPYIHSVAKWKAWMTTSMINFGAFSVTIERVRTIGPLVCLNFQTVTRSLLDFHVTIPLSQWFHDSCRVPDVVQWFETGRIRLQSQVRHFIVPNNVVVALTAYAQRTADDAYKFVEISSYASGLRRSIVIGKEQYQAAWNCGAEEYSRVVTSLFIIGASQRTERTQTIAGAFRYLRDNYKREPWLNPLVRFFEGLFGGLKPIHTTIDDDHLPKFRPIPIEDVVTIEVYQHKSISRTAALIAPCVFGKYSLQNLAQVNHAAIDEEGDSDGFTSDSDQEEFRDAAPYPAAHPRPETELPDAAPFPAAHPRPQIRPIFVRPERRKRAGSIASVTPSLFNIFEEQPAAQDAAPFPAAHPRPEHAAHPEGRGRADSAASLTPSLFNIFEPRPATPADASSDDEEPADHDGTGFANPTYVKRQAYTAELFEPVPAIVVSADPIVSELLSPEFHKCVTIEQALPTPAPTSAPPAARASNDIVTFICNRNQFDHLVYRGRKYEGRIDAPPYNKVEQGEFVRIMDEDDNDRFFNIKVLRVLHYKNFAAAMRDLPHHECIDSATAAHAVKLYEGIGRYKERQKKNGVLFLQLDSRAAAPAAASVNGEFEGVDKLLASGSITVRAAGKTEKVSPDTEASVKSTSDKVCTCQFALKSQEAINWPKQLADIRDATYKALPKRFVAGHCAMEAFHAAYLHTTRDMIRPQDVFRAVARGCIDSHVDVACYIHHARSDLDVSGFVLPALSAQFNVAIRLVAPGVPPLLFDLTTKPQAVLTINHNGANAPFGHFYYSPNGGAPRSPKFAKIIADCGFRGRVLDTSCAPGEFSMQLQENKSIDLISCHFMKGEPIKVSLNKAAIPYNDFLEIPRKVDGKFDCIFNDAARRINSETIISDINRHALSMLKEGGMLVTKSFGNGNDVFSIYSMYFDTIVERVYSVDGSERYFQLDGYHMKCSDEAYQKFFSAYEDYHRNETIHVLPTPRNLKKFTDEYFRSMDPKYLPMFAVAPEFKNFEIHAITGVASAAKTTVAVEKYGQKAIFIAPSKTLSLRHQKSGVRSYTPHVVFSQFSQPGIKKPEYIVIDEISQFPLHYVALVHAYFPDSKIIVLGDVMQTPYINYPPVGKDGKPLKNVKPTDYPTLRQYGITNNILTAYKIPQDIARALNNRHDLNILSKSEVAQGVCIFKGDIKEFAGSKIPVIAFNDATVKKLCDMKINAHTITTYTGSRDHTVVFFVDSASIASQIINKSEWLYTAMSRATNQLVIAGDHEPITNYYAIHGSPVRLFEEISGAYLQNDHKVHVDKPILVAVPEQLAKFSASAETASAILQEHIHPVNDPENEFILTTKPELPPVESGVLKTNLDVAATRDYSTKVYKISLSKFVKNQISSSTQETLATLIKRYSRKYIVKMTKPVRAATTGELRNGLMRALYGKEGISQARFAADMKLSPEELRDYTVQYYDKLQLKMNANPSIAKEFEKLWEPVNEYLTFFNKRQAKFDPKSGFDTSDKVGQGVAANSKAVNIIFGGYSRAMIEKVRKIATANGRRIILATHDSEEQLNNDFVAMMADAPRNPDWACNDFSEWDASFRTPFADLTAWLLEMLGADPQLIKWLSDFRAKWTMIYRSSEGITKLDGFEKQFSGNPFTIVENTIGNMALCFAIFVYKAYNMALFKGDDSAVLCDKCTLSTRGKEIISITGHGLKLHIGPIGEFAGWFLTPEGLFPDVVRYAAKFLDKNYRDEEHFKEAQLSLQERLSVVKNETQVRFGIHTAAQHYNEIDLGFTAEQIHNLYGFIRHSRSIKFASLDTKIISNLVPN